jgi:hypothetical protein
MRGIRALYVRRPQDRAVGIRFLDIGQREKRGARSARKLGAGEDLRMKTTSLAAWAFVLAGGCMSPLTLAQAPEDLDAEKLISQNCKLEPPAYRIRSACAPSRFRGYEPTYGIYKWTQDDESSIRAHFSFRYLIFTADCVGTYRRTSAATERKVALDKLRDCFDGENRRHEWYLMYTGEFDFYWGTRPSSPVINRINNPGFHYRLYNEDSRFQWFDFGVEHRSDGQTTDVYEEVVTPAGKVRVAELAYQRGDHAYFDTVSRATNYFTAETHYLASRSIDLQARVKLLYFGNETDITWGPLADQGVKMRDYDRFRFILNYTIGGRKPDRTLGEQPSMFAEWTVGDKMLQSDSLNLGLYLPIPTPSGRLPFFARVHLGPMETLSNYTQNQTSFGLGLMFIE